MDDVKEMLRCLGALVEHIDYLRTNSYCELCDRHAPKSSTGGIIGPINHKDDCPLECARALIESEKARK